MGHTLAAAPAYFPVLFEITYMVASRGVQTLDIKLSQMDLDRATGGIYVDRRKGSVSNHIEWSDRLFAAYHAAMKHRQEHKIADINASLILSDRSKRLTRSGLDSAIAASEARNETARPRGQLLDASDAENERTA